jgi:hypothetical protein
MHRKRSFQRSSIIWCLAALAITWQLLPRRLATGVFIEPFPSNCCLCWLHSLDFRQICHNIHAKSHEIWLGFSCIISIITSTFWEVVLLALLMIVSGGMIYIPEMLSSKFLRRGFNCFCIYMITQFLVSSSTVQAQNVSLINYYWFCVSGENLRAEYFLKMISSILCFNYIPFFKGNFAR